MGLPVLAGLGVAEKVLDLFKKKGKAVETVQNAVSTVKEFFGKDAKEDPEAMKIIRDHELEMEREYTKRAQGALDVMKAEASSEDAYVRRARPTLMYVGYAVLFNVFIVCPLAHLKITDYIDSQVLYWFFWMFSSGYLGYGVLRTSDKNGLQLPLFGPGNGKK